MLICADYCKLVPQLLDGMMSLDMMHRQEADGDKICQFVLIVSLIMKKISMLQTKHLFRLIIHCFRMLSKKSWPVKKSASSLEIVTLI
jgi:hypothetical protein